MTPHIISGGTISAYLPGGPRVIDDSHANFDQIRTRLREGADPNEIQALVDSASKLRQQTIFLQTTLVTVGVDAVLFNGAPLHNHLCDRIIALAHAGQSIEPYVAFLERLMQNPNAQVREDLFEWMEKAGMPVTPDGYFLAYKKVRDDYTSFHDGATRNDIGSSPFMPRTDCDESRYRECSTGLHFCGFTYLPSYNGNQGKVVVLKINPADVVAIPTDYGRAKGRAWRYTVVDEVPEADVKFAFPEPVYATVYDEHDDEEEFLPEETQPVGLFGKLRAWSKRFLN